MSDTFIQGVTTNPSQRYIQMVGMDDAIADGSDNYRGLSIIDKPLGSRTFSVDGSIFNGCLASGIPSYDCNMGFPGDAVANLSVPDYCAGYGAGAKTPEDYYDKYKKAYSAQLKAENEMRHMQEAEDLKYSTREDALAMHLGILQKQIKNNEQDNIKSEYATIQSLINEKLSDEYGLSVNRGHKDGLENQVSEDQVRAMTCKLYRQYTGQNLYNDLETNGDSAFVHGFKKGILGIGYMFTDKTSAQENITEMTGNPPSKSEKYEEMAGRVTGIVGSIIAVPLAIVGAVGICKGIGKLTRASWSALFHRAPKKVPAASVAA